MVRTQEELMNQFSAIIGEDNTDDNVLNFMTDMKDTFADNGADTIGRSGKKKMSLISHGERNTVMLLWAKGKTLLTMVMMVSPKSPENMKIYLRRSE